MKYELESLLRLRQFRVTLAIIELRKMKEKLEQAKETEKKKKEELDNYKKWRINKENVMYEEIRNKHVTVKDLDDLKLKVLMMRNKEIFYVNALNEAKAAVETAKGDVRAAKDVYNNAMKNQTKIEEHKKIWVKKQYEIQQYKEDQEIEELQKHMKFEEEEYEHNSTEEEYGYDSNY